MLLREIYQDVQGEFMPGPGKFDFSHVLVALRCGRKVSREFWGNPEAYIYLEEVVTRKMGQTDSRTRRIMLKEDGDPPVEWTPSQASLLAEDWYIVQSDAVSAVSGSPARTV